MVTYEIVKEIATLSETDNATKRLALVSWNGAPAKIDIRSWLKDGKPLKGVTLNEDEARQLVEVLNDYYA